MEEGILQAIFDIGDLILEVILPSRERVRRTKSRKPEDLELFPESHELCGITITTLMNYKSDSAQDTVRALKYDGLHHAAKLCAALLADYLREEIASIKSFSPRPILLVPVPLHKNRERERGFNQIARVLEELPEEFKNGMIAQIEPDALTRIKETKQQTHLSRSERLSNVQNAFQAGSAADGAYVLVIDDVATTGATLASCVEALEEGGASAGAIALARA